jgi:hypothetical protein
MVFILANISDIIAGFVKNIPVVVGTRITLIPIFDIS